MALTNLRLAGGRGVDLTHLEVSSTYGGLLEGAAVPSFNNRHIEGLTRRLTKRYPHMGFHLVPPTRSYPDPIDTGFGGEPQERPLPFSDDAKGQLAAIDWDQHARDCEM